NVLNSAVEGIAEIINNPGLINVDFSDVKTVMSEMGVAVIGSGFSEGPDRAISAAKEAVSCPLLEEVNLNNAKGILVNISASKDFKMREYFEVMDHIKKYAAENASIIVGSVIDESLNNHLRVTMVATGLSVPANAYEPSKTGDIEPNVLDSTNVIEEINFSTEGGDGLNVFEENHGEGVGISSLEDDSEYDTPSFLRSRNKENDFSKND
ncbi:MAG: cell division protein FtsZ, partial [Nitrosomonadales bacterium]|nr:cell division protein FtsZ [Nitrosomonadales bacterium]